MKLKGYKPDWEWYMPEAQAYYDEWRKQYPNLGPSAIILRYVADHDPFIELLSSYETKKTEM